MDHGSSERQITVVAAALACWLHKGYMGLRLAYTGCSVISLDTVNGLRQELEIDSRVIIWKHSGHGQQRGSDV